MVNKVKKKPVKRKVKKTTKKVVKRKAKPKKGGRRSLPLNLTDAQLQKIMNDNKARLDREVAYRNKHPFKTMFKKW